MLIEVSEAAFLIFNLHQGMVKKLVHLGFNPGDEPEVTYLVSKKFAREVFDRVVADGNRIMKTGEYTKEDADRYHGTDSIKQYVDIARQYLREM